MTRKAEFRRAIRDKEKAEFMLAFVGAPKPRRCLSDEAREKQSKQLASLNSSRKGKPLSLDHKMALSDKIRGRKLPKRSKEQKEYLSSIRGYKISVYGVQYNNAVEAHRITGMPINKLRNMAKDPSIIDIWYIDKK